MSSTAMVDEQVLQAMSTLPPEDTEWFYMAYTSLPDMVKEESDPLWYYKRENGDAVKAATRLALAWKVRYQIFRDRALKPIKLLNGQGALDALDLEYLRSGYYVRLPNALEGRSVFCVNRDNIMKSSSLGGSDDASLCRQRVLFYFFGYVAPQQPRAQEENGVIAMRAVLTDTTFDRTLQKKLLQVVHNVFPIRTSQMHFFMLVPETVDMNWYETNIVRVIRRVSSENWGQGFEPAIIVAQSKKEMMHNIEKLNTFYPHGIPEAIGGHWSYNKFTAWVDYRAGLLNQQNKVLTAKAQAVINLRERKVIKSKMDRTFRKHRQLVKATMSAIAPSSN